MKVNIHKEHGTANINISGPRNEDASTFHYLVLITWSNDSSLSRVNDMQQWEFIISG